MQGPLDRRAPFCLRLEAVVLPEREPASRGFLLSAADITQRRARPLDNPFMTLGGLVSGTLQLLWPARCAACDRGVDDQTIFCGQCAPSLSPLLNACPGCALPRRDAAHGARCVVCRRVPFPFRDAAAGYEYGAALADAVVRMKHGQRWMARRLGPLLVTALMELVTMTR